MRVCRLVPLLLVLLFSAGCGGFAARRIVQAPNTYPKWLAPKAPVTLAFTDQILAGFTNQYVRIESPEARIRYRIVEPGDYEFSWTNSVDAADGQLQLSFSADISALQERTNAWTHNPKGTVVLLHGYGVSGFAMLPWGLLLAQEGWRCVVVDLRGHGKSSGSQIYFGVQEVRDLSALLDQLQENGQIESPVSVIGHSYGAVLALRWKLADPRVERVVALSPYAELSRAALNIADQYARWVPRSFIRAGLRRLPHLLQVPPGELNPEHWIAQMEAEGHAALFIAGGADRTSPVDQVELLHRGAGQNSKLIVLPNAAHEPLPFYLDALAGPITQWLSGEPLEIAPSHGPRIDPNTSGANHRSENEQTFSRFSGTN